MNSAKKIVPILRPKQSQPSRGPLASGAPSAVPGEVVAVVDHDVFDVRVGQSTHHASRAPSCLLVPQPGDEVWLLPTAAGDLVIAGVLRRAGEATAVVELPGQGTELRSAGELRIKSQRAIELNSSEEVRIRGAKLDVSTLRTRIASEALEVFATRVDVGMEKARVVAKKLDAAFDSLVMRMKQSLRWVEELDQVRAGLIDYRAEGNARLHGDCAFVSADRVVQVRGEEIHLS